MHYLQNIGCDFILHLLIHVLIHRELKKACFRAKQWQTQRFCFQRKQRGESRFYYALYVICSIAKVLVIQTFCLIRQSLFNKSNSFKQIWFFKLFYDSIYREWILAILVNQSFIRINWFQFLFSTSNCRILEHVNTM